MSGGGTNTVTNNTAPPPEFLNAYRQVLDRATGVANQPLQQYSGPMVAGFTPQQQQGFDIIGGAQGIANPYINSAAGMISNATAPILPTVAPTLGTAQGYISGAANTNFAPTAFSGDELGKYMNPFTKDVIGATEAQFNQQNALQRQQYQGNAIAQGAFGGDREAVGEGILGGQQQMAEAPVIAGLESQNYQQAQQEFNTQQQVQQQAKQLGAQTGLAAGQGTLGVAGQQLGATEAERWLASQGAFGLAGLGSEALNTTLEGANALLGAGGMQQSLAQEQLNIPYEQFLQQQAYPFQTTQFLGGLAEGLGGASGGTSSSTQPGPSTLSQVGGLGITGLGIAGLLGAFARRGGRIPHRAGGGLMPSVPDLSASFVPNVATPRGAGPPRAPAPVSSEDPMAQGMNFLTEAAMLGRAANRNTRGRGITGGIGGAMGSGLSDAELGNLSTEAMENVGAGAAGMRGGGIVPFRRAAGGVSGSFTAKNGVSIPLLSTAGPGTGGHVDTTPMSFFSPPSPAHAPSVTIPNPAAPGPQGIAGAAPKSANELLAAGDPQATQDWLAFQGANIASAGGGGGAKRGGGIAGHYDEGGEIDDLDLVTPDEGRGYVPLRYVQNSPYQDPGYGRGPAPAPRGALVDDPRYGDPGYAGGPPPPPADTADAGPTSQDYPGGGAGYTPRQPSGRGERMAAQAPWLGLIGAGLGIMGGRSPHAAVNIGQGGLQGLGMFARQEQAANQTSEREEEQEDTGRYRQASLQQHADEFDKHLEVTREGIKQHGQQLANQQEHQAAQLAETAQHNRAIEGETAQYHRGELGLRKRAEDTAEQRANTDRFTYQPWEQPDPNDPTKTVQGMMRTSTRQGEAPEFIPLAGKAPAKADASKWQVLTDPEHQDESGNVVPSRQYRYNPQTAQSTTLDNQPYTPSGALKTGTDKSGPGAMGSREAVFSQRVLQASNQASKDLENVVNLPASSTSGIFGGGGPKSTTHLLDAGAGVLSNQMTGQEAQTYNAMSTGFQRTLAAIESAGLMPSGSLTHQMDSVIFKEGDSNLTKLHKLAQTRQIVESGLETMLENPRVSKDEKAHAQAVMERIQKAVPFSHSDLIKLSAAQAENPNATLRDVMPKRPSPPIATATPGGASPASAPPAGLPEGSKRIGSTKDGAAVWQDANGKKYRVD
jgi:hypothetical protein